MSVVARVHHVKLIRLRQHANVLLCLVRQQQDEHWQDKVRRMGPRAAGKRPWPGCTALAMLIKGGRMLVANAGDICQLEYLDAVQNATCKSANSVLYTIAMLLVVKYPGMCVQQQQLHLFGQYKCPNIGMLCFCKQSEEALL